MIITSCYWLFLDFYFRYMQHMSKCSMESDGFVCPKALGVKVWLCEAAA